MIRTVLSSFLFNDFLSVVYTVLLYTCFFQCLILTVLIAGDMSAGESLNPLCLVYIQERRRFCQGL